MGRASARRIIKRTRMEALERENTELRQALAQHPSQLAIADDGRYEEGRLDGWNEVITLIIAKHTEPLNDAWSELEHAIGVMQGTALAAHKLKRLHLIKDQLQELAEDIGRCLNILDIHNSALEPLLGGDYVDVTTAQLIRRTALDYINGSVSGDTLAEILSYNPRIERISTALTALKQTRKSRPDPLYVMVGKRVEKEITNGKKVLPASIKVASDIYAEDGQKYTPGTVKAYYHKWVKAGRPL